MATNVRWIDWFVIVAYCATMIALGWYYSRKQTTTCQFFTGNRAMNPVLIGISLFAALLSTISYLGGPGEIIRNGPMILVGAFSIPIAFIVIGYVLIPAFMKHRLTSAYELLELRLGLSTRLLGASMFILLRLMWMSTLLNFTSRALVVILGWDDAWLLPVSLVIGAVALAYSSLGGIQAVVINDLVQSLCLFLGALLTILLVTLSLGGLRWIPMSWDSSWATQPVFSFDPFVRLTVIGVIVMQALWAICTAGGDQTYIQRFMSTQDAAAARRSYLITSIASLMVTCVLAMVGFSLLAYYRAFPQFLPTGQTLSESADKLFPHFIATRLPPGISGLVIVGILSAAMSIDSGVNSISAVVTCDFVNRFRRRPLGNLQQVHVAQAVTIAIGLIVITGSTLVEFVPGNLFEIAKRVTGLLMAPLFLLLFMAMFVPRATATGANAGALAAFAAAVTISFWNPLFGDRSPSITWITPISLIVGLTVGYAVSGVGALRATLQPADVSQ